MESFITVVLGEFLGSTTLGGKIISFILAPFESMFGIFIYAYRNFGIAGCIVSLIAVGILLNAFKKKGKDGNEEDDDDGSSSPLYGGMGVIGGMLTGHYIWAIIIAISSIVEYNKFKNRQNTEN